MSKVSDHSPAHQPLGHGARVVSVGATLLAAAGLVLAGLVLVNPSLADAQEDAEHEAERAGVTGSVALASDSGRASTTVAAVAANGPNAKPGDLGVGGEVAAGERIFRAAGGCTCHTNYPGEGESAPALAGGRALATPFGTYYSTNITRDRKHGLGAWSQADFVRAMREGLSPEGQHYFPVFPFTSFSGLTDRDLLDMAAYLVTLPAHPRANKAPDAIFPFSWRATLTGWKWMNFTPKTIDPVPDQSDVWNRGRYLVEAAAHCGECHTPRTLTGGLDATRSLAGSAEGPEGELAPNITPHETTGIGSWTGVDLTWYLETGLKPDGDDTQGLMSEVIEHGYSNLPPEDLRAIAAYILSVPAIENRVTIERD